MLEKLAGLFRSDDFIPSSAVFPEIDKNRIAQELALEQVGAERGKKDQPESDAKTLDHVENEIIGRVEELRRRGLESFENNRHVYAERLGQAGNAYQLVDMEAKNAKAGFTSHVKMTRAEFVTPRKQVEETYRWQEEFRKRNRLIRPAKAAASWFSIIGLSLVMIFLESVGNAYLFAQANPLGLLGGLMAAFLVSLGNVSMSTLLGMATRYINCRNLLKKTFGLVMCLIWLAFVAIYNLGVAHFRDAAERIGEWREAGIIAIQSMQESPIGLETMESYILVVLGLFISIVAWLKGYHSFDPYPGYTKVSNDVVQARQRYSDELDYAIELLKGKHDEAVDALRDARDEVQRSINDSIDALYGQQAMSSGLRPFVEQCNIATNYLLSIYRDENKSARSEPAPAYFNVDYVFADVEVSEFETQRKKAAEKEVKKVTDLVSKTTHEIWQKYEEAVNNYYDIDELEGGFADYGHIPTRPTANTVVPDTVGS